jgi:hypothetical protein
LTRYDRWTQRVMDGALDFWGEHWQDLSNTAQYAAWRQLAQARGVNSDLQHHMTRSLLPEVIYAAGGVERELGQLQAALADVQRFADEASLLSWARSTVERTERKDRGQPAGLLPALAPGPLYDSVDAALRDSKPHFRITGDWQTTRFMWAGDRWRIG